VGDWKYPSTEAVDANEAGRQWNRLLDLVARNEGRILLQRDGVPVAALILTADMRRLQTLDDEIRRDIEILEASRRAFADVPDEELEREIGRAVAEAREELRLQQKASPGS